MNIRSSLASLPAPTNDFEFIFPDEDESNQEESNDKSENMVEDAADVEERNSVSVDGGNNRTWRLILTYFRRYKRWKRRKNWPGVTHRFVLAFPAPL